MFQVYTGSVRSRFPTRAFAGAKRRAARDGFAARRTLARESRPPGAV